VGIGFDFKIESTHNDENGANLNDDSRILYFTTDIYFRSFVVFFIKTDQGLIATGVSLCEDDEKTYYPILHGRPVSKLVHGRLINIFIIGEPSDEPINEWEIRYIQTKSRVN